MTSTLYYLFQVVLCSAILMAYYALVLRDKKFHHYNRFYLMAVIVLSWTVPLIDIHWTGQGEGQVTEVVNFIALQNTQWKQAPGWGWSNTELLGCLVYAMVGLFLVFKMVRAYGQLWRLQKTHSHTTVGKVKLFQTDLGEAPFSFFNAIFWNRAIDPQTSTGQKMMAHELTHVREKHSLDKLLLQANRALGWFNPFFWLLAKEMDMVHEFIADQKAVDQGDAAALAEVLLAAAHPQRFFGLSHPFFFSPIQRRLKMIASNNKTPFSYLRRIIALPLLAMVLVLVSFKQKDATTTHLSLATVMENLAHPVLQNPTDVAAVANAQDTVVLNPDSVYMVPAGKKIRLVDDPRGPNDFKDVRIEASKGMAFVGGVDSNNRSTGVIMGKPLAFTKDGEAPLLIVDGVKVPYEKMKDLDPKEIATVNIRKGEKAGPWGEAGKNGVIEVITKAYAKANNIDVKSIPIAPLNKTTADGQPLKVVEGQPLKVVEGQPLNGAEAPTGKVIHAQSMKGAEAPQGEVVEVMGYALPDAPKVADKTIIVLNGKIITWEDLEAFPADRIESIKIEKGKGGSAKKIIIVEKAPTKSEMKKYESKKGTAPPPPPPPAKKKN